MGSGEAGAGEREGEGREQLLETAAGLDTALARLAAPGTAVTKQAVMQAADKVGNRSVFINGVFI